MNICRFILVFGYPRAGAHTHRHIHFLSVNDDDNDDNFYSVCMITLRSPENRYPPNVTINPER